MGKTGQHWSSEWQCNPLEHRRLIRVHTGSPVPEEEEPSPYESTHLVAARRLTCGARPDGGLRWQRGWCEVGDGQLGGLEGWDYNSSGWWLRIPVALIPVLTHCLVWSGIFYPTDYCDLVVVMHSSLFTCILSPVIQVSYYVLVFVLFVCVLFLC